MKGDSSADTQITADFADNLRHLFPIWVSAVGFLIQLHPLYRIDTGLSNWYAALFRKFQGATIMSFQMNVTSATIKGVIGNDMYAKRETAFFSIPPVSNGTATFIDKINKGEGIALFGSGTDNPNEAAVAILPGIYNGGHEYAFGMIQNQVAPGAILDHQTLAGLAAFFSYLAAATEPK